MEDQTCRVHDSIEMLTVKINRFIDANRNSVLKAVSDVAKRHTRPLGPIDREFIVATYAIPRETGEACAEYLLPRCIIYPAEHDLLEARKLIDAILINGRMDPMETDKDKKRVQCEFSAIPKYSEIGPIAHNCINNDEFERRVAKFPKYIHFRTAWSRLSLLIHECQELAKRQCSYGCGTYGANKQCDQCNGFFCCDTCFDGHKDIGKCKQ